MFLSTTLGLGIIWFTILLYDFGLTEPNLLYNRNDKIKQFIKNGLQILLPILDEFK